MDPVNYNNLRPAGRKRIREAYIVEQGGLCHHCGASLDGDPSDEIKSMDIDWMMFPTGFLKYPVHLHHDHNTGMTIGAVHSLCNAVLWQYHGE